MKKTIAKNTKQPSAAAPGGAVKQYPMPFISFREREFNRNLPVNYIMASLARWMPYQHRLAKVAGGLISIQFQAAPIQRVRQELSEFGFSWNEKRNCWQHYGARGNV